MVVWWDNRDEVERQKASTVFDMRKERKKEKWEAWKGRLEEEIEDGG